jgi:hypothetical protein
MLKLWTIVRTNCIAPPPPPSTDFRAFLVFAHACYFLRFPRGLFYSRNYSQAEFRAAPPANHCLLEQNTAFGRKPLHQIKHGIDGAYISLHPRIGGTWANAAEPWDGAKHPVRFSFRTLSKYVNPCMRLHINILTAAGAAKGVLYGKMCMVRCVCTGQRR